MGTLRFVVLRDGQQRIHVLFYGLIFLGLVSRRLVFSKELFLLCVQCGELCLHTLGSRQRNGAQAFELTGGGLKKNDLAFVAPHKFLFISRPSVLIVDRFQLPIGGGVLHHKGELRAPCLDGLYLGMGAVPFLGDSGRPAFQFGIIVNVKSQYKESECSTTFQML